jgi:hypothetical protein
MREYKFSFVSGCWKRNTKHPQEEMARRAQNLQTRMCSDMHAYAHGDTVLQAVLHEHIRTAHAWSDPGAAQQI